MTPDYASVAVWRSMKSDEKSEIKPKKPAFAVGDWVRISRSKGTMSE